jgi:hypothetical protein
VLVKAFYFCFYKMLQLSIVVIYTTEELIVANKIVAKEILGEHPQAGLGSLIIASDDHTKSGVPHRALSEYDGQRETIVTCIREMLMRHHASPEMLEREKERIESMKRLGYEAYQSRMSRFPINPNTQKGNLAEIFLAEYLVAAANISLPVYRLRYNPNVDQSMKGDDVLAFDLDSKPIRILVGETKFRETSSKTAVTEIVDALVRSHKGGIPVSLQFVANRLFDMGKNELGEKVVNCATLFAIDQLRLDYVGLLMSDTQSAERLKQHTKNCLHHLVVISFGVDAPTALNNSCFTGLGE